MLDYKQHIAREELDTLNPLFYRLVRRLTAIDHFSREVQASLGERLTTLAATTPAWARALAQQLHLPLPASGSTAPLVDYSLGGLREEEDNRPFPSAFSTDDEDETDLEETEEEEAPAPRLSMGRPTRTSRPSASADWQAAYAHNRLFQALTDHDEAALKAILHLPQQAILRLHPSKGGHIVIIARAPAQHGEPAYQPRKPRRLLLIC